MYRFRSRWVLYNTLITAKNHHRVIHEALPVDFKRATVNSMWTIIIDNQYSFLRFCDDIALLSETGNSFNYIDSYPNFTYHIDNIRQEYGISITKSLAIPQSLSKYVRCVRLHLIFKSAIVEEENMQKVIDMIYTKLMISIVPTFSHIIMFLLVCRYTTFHWKIVLCRYKYVLSISPHASVVIYVNSNLS